MYELLSLQLLIKHVIFGSMFVGVLVFVDDNIIDEGLEGEARSSGLARQARLQVPRTINVILSPKESTDQPI